MYNANIHKLENDNLYSSVKIEIFPDRQTKRIMLRNIDLSRAVYNWGIDIQEEIYRKHLEDDSNPARISLYDLQSLFSKERKENPDMEYFKDISIGSARCALKNVYDAYDRFFDKRLENKHPKFKTRKKSKKTFGVKYDTSGIKNGRLKIEGIGRGNTIDIKTHLFDDYGYNYDLTPLNIPWINPTISFKNNRFFLSFTYQIEPDFFTDKKTEPIGIDLGVVDTMVLSTGEVFNQPSVEKENKKISKLNNQISRDYKRRLDQSIKTRTKLCDIPKSKNEKAREALLNKYYTKKHNKLNNSYHKMVNNVVNRNPEFICIEDIRVKKFRRQRPGSKKYLARVSFYDIRRKFEYKCDRKGVTLIIADNHFPSSQLCSKCGARGKLGSHRLFRCPECGNVINRDLNASINLKKLGDSVINN